MQGSPRTTTKTNNNNIMASGSIKSLVDINAKVFVKVLIVECCCLMISIIERLVFGCMCVYLCICVSVSGIYESEGSLGMRFYFIVLILLVWCL